MAKLEWFHFFFRLLATGMVLGLLGAFAWLGLTQSDMSIGLTVIVAAFMGLSIQTAWWLKTLVLPGTSNQPSRGSSR